MTPEQFAYWLQGFSELNSNPPTVAQWEGIKNHLALVFKKVTPSIYDPNVTVRPSTLPTPYNPNWMQWLDHTDTRIHTQC